MSDSDSNSNNDRTDELDEDTRELVDQVDDQLEEIGAEEQPDDESANTDEEMTGSDDTTPGVEGEETGSQKDSAAEKVWGAVISAVMTVLKVLVMAPLSKIPKRTKIYQGMIKTGYQAMYKNTSANVVVNTIYGDRYVVPRPAEVDETEAKVKTNNGEEWTMPDGLQTYHMGQARMMWGVADAHELVSPVGARTAEKVDLGDSVYVKEPQQQQQAGPRAGQRRQSRQAVADGGYAGMDAKSLSAWEGEKFSDVLVNWANTNPDADGMIVSMEKHYELQHSQAGAEEMKKQEDRGRLAERLSDGKRQGLIYVGLLLLGLAVGMFGPSLATSIAGGEGGGSSISLFLLPLLGV